MPATIRGKPTNEYLARLFNELKCHNALNAWTATAAARSCVVCTRSNLASREVGTVHAGVSARRQGMPLPAGPPV